MTVLLTVIQKLLKSKCLIVLTYVGFIKEREKEQDNEHEIFRWIADARQCTMLFKVCASGALRVRLLCPVSCSKVSNTLYCGCY